VQGVASSNPATPTIFQNRINGLEPKALTRFSLCLLRCSGLKTMLMGLKFG
jgi:hypothetical protein